MELQFRYEIYDNNHRYLGGADSYTTTTLSNMYELVAIGYLYDYPSRSEVIGKLIKKAESLTRKEARERYRLKPNQFTVEVELLPGDCHEIHTNQFIDGFFKWYINQVYCKHNHILYDEYGPAHFIGDAIHYFEHYYQGDLATWVWKAVRKHTQK